MNYLPILLLLALVGCSTYPAQPTAAERAQQQLDAITTEKGKYVLGPAQPTTRIVERKDGIYIE